MEEEKTEVEVEDGKVVEGKVKVKDSGKPKVEIKIKIKGRANEGKIRILGMENRRPLAAPDHHRFHSHAQGEGVTGGSVCGKVDEIEEGEVVEVKAEKEEDGEEKKKEKKTDVEIEKHRRKKKKQQGLSVRINTLWMQ